MMQTPTAAPAAIDRAFLAEIESYLAPFGLKVTKARATARGSSTSTARADGATLATVRASKRHGSCAEHWRVPGMAEPVCISRDRDENGAPIGPEWANVDTVLAFAVDVGARMTEYRTCASVGYVAADQSSAILPEHFRRTTYREPIAHNLHGGIPRKQDGPNGPASWTAYGLRIGCETCTEQRAEQDAAEARKAEQERMQATPHDFTSSADYMATCNACGKGRAHDAHTWAPHIYNDRYGECRTCGKVPQGHTEASA